MRGGLLTLLILLILLLFHILQNLECHSHPLKVKKVPLTGKLLVLFVFLSFCRHPQTLLLSYHGTLFIYTAKHFYLILCVINSIDGK